VTFRVRGRAAPAALATTLIGSLVGTLVLAGCAGSGGSKAAAKPPVVQVSVSACGKGWADGTAGETTLHLTDTDTRGGEVDLVSASSGAVYAEVEPMGPGTSVDMSASLGAGSYALRCYMDDEPMVTGPTVRLTGSAHGSTPAVQAISQGDLVPAAKAYEAYVTGVLPTLAAQVATLRTDVSGDHLATARRDWLTAHLTWMRLGAAYGAFGDVADDIDGRADGLAEGVDDPSWHGFHRLEYGLWHGQSAATLTPVATTLVSDVASLRRAFPTEQVDPLDIGIRAHEITEDAVEFSLTGRDDYGSHSALVTVLADIDATREVLKVVHTVLTPRYKALPTAQQQLSTTAADVRALAAADGSLPPLADLTRSQRERIDSDVSQLAEDLAPVASILEPRRTS
jgi:iron uptake system component EfeO